MSACGALADRDRYIIGTRIHGRRYKAWNCTSAKPITVLARVQRPTHWLLAKRTLTVNLLVMIAFLGVLSKQMDPLSEGG